MEVLLLASAKLFLHVFLCNPLNVQTNTIITVLHTVRTDSKMKTEMIKSKVTP